MKAILLILCSIALNNVVSAQSGSVDKTSGEYSFKSSLGSQYMFYGYESPGKHSKKMICFSAYPGNISNNSSYNLPLGAYHETTSLKDGDKIIYKGKKNGYAEMEFIDADNKVTTFYIRSGYVKE